MTPGDKGPVEKFAHECMRCLTDDGMLDAGELDSLRELADELDLSHTEKAESHTMLTRQLIGSLKKRGFNAAKSGQIATKILAQLGQI